ncbi:thermonuclease family protein [Paucihalobacter sp.]|uniref:thermonuclease family protein n=1 Tax=Paucihalobacter sp. TaxID=2850405 RepID=UPI002FE3216D
MHNITRIIVFVCLMGLTNCQEPIAYTATNPNLKRTHTSSQKAQKYVDGKVIKIADGDTFTMIFDNGFEVRVRLNGIDSPEKKQAFSNKAKQALSAMIFKKEVRVYYKSKDKYGRVLGDVFIDSLNVNHEMVKQGMAWHFTRYSDDKTLATLEQEARKNRVGLWVDPNPVAPWEFRLK